MTSGLAGVKSYGLFHEMLMRTPQLGVTAQYLEPEAASPRLPSGPSGKAEGLLGGISPPPTATRESGVGGGVSAASRSSAACSCHGTLSLGTKAAVEEAVLLCVAVKEVVSMPLSVEAPWRKPLSSRSLLTPEREPTSYHFSSLWAELEALLESVLLLDWLDEYWAS